MEEKGIRLDALVALLNGQNSELADDCKKAGRLRELINERGEDPETDIDHAFALGRISGKFEVINAFAALIMTESFENVHGISVESLAQEEN